MTQLWKLGENINRNVIAEILKRTRSPTEASLLSMPGKSQPHRKQGISMNYEAEK